MKLIRKHAIYTSIGVEMDVVIIGEMHFSLSKSIFVVPVRFDNGVLKTVNLDDLQIVDREIKPPEFLPDWDIVTYDFLAMDKNGEWHSFASPNIHYCEGEWLFNIRKDTNQAFREANIQYRHPQPYSAFYIRPTTE